MFMQERHKEIADTIAAKGKITIGEITQTYGISDESARRDLRLLEQQGVCKRTHGGAILPQQVGFRPPVDRKFESMPIFPNYREIAKRAVSLIQKNDIVYMTGGSFGHIMAKIVAVLGALLWGGMLRLDPNGLCLALVVCALWIFRKNELYRNFAGAIATVACCMVSPLFIAAPMGFLVVHFYNGKQGKDADLPRAVRCLAYPALLLAAYAVGMVL